MLTELLDMLINLLNVVSEIKIIRIALLVVMASGILKPYAWLRQQGVAHNAAHMIISGKYRQPTLNMIEKLCPGLGCLPNDILVWAPDKDGPTDVPLAALLPKDEQMFDWMKDLENMPPELLRALGEKAKELGKGV